VRTTDPAFLELLRRYIGRFRVDEPGPFEIVFSADLGEDRALPGGKVVRGKLNLYYEYLRIYEGRLKDEMAARLINFCRDAATQVSNEFIRVRAGAVATADGAILMPSVPEPHLPALVGLMVRDGAGYLGDEMANVDPILEGVHGLALPLMIDGDDLLLFPELGREKARGRRLKIPEDIRATTPRRVVLPEEIGGSFAEPARLGWVVYPYFEPGAETRLEPFGGAKAVFGFTQAMINLHVWEDRALVLMKELLDTVPVSRLVVGSLPDAARLVLETAPSMIEGVSA
jgi:hypothetical protein